MDDLKDNLLKMANAGELQKNDTIITNNRHYDSLLESLGSYSKSQRGYGK